MDAPSRRPALGLAVIVTTAALWLAGVVSAPETYTALEALGTLVWVSAVLSALTFVTPWVESGVRSPWTQLFLLALTAASVSAATNVIFFFISE